MFSSFILTRRWISLSGSADAAAPDVHATETVASTMLRIAFA
jgi:hypothetical protein